MGFFLRRHMSQIELDPKDSTELEDILLTDIFSWSEFSFENGDI